VATAIIVRVLFKKDILLIVQGKPDKVPDPRLVGRVQLAIPEIA
jgi:hypothetical protein